MEKLQGISRRDFIKTSALLSGLMISFNSAATSSAKLSSVGDKAAVMNALLHIGEDDAIHIFLTKVEMGQGMWTTLPMLIAEELDCDWKKIQVHHHPSGTGNDFAQSIYVTSTGGSDSTRSEFDRYRMVGATARQMLINAAAKKFNVPAEACKTENGVIIAGHSRVRYGEVAATPSLLPVPAVSLRGPREWKYIGKSQKRLDTAEKINGAAKYGMDIQFPGLFTAVVAHAPVFGLKVKSFDAALSKAVQGVEDVVQVPSGIAVVAKHYWAAKRGRDALKIEWEPVPDAQLHDSNKQRDEYLKLAKTKGAVSQEKGDVSAALAGASTSFDAEYVLPYLAHAPMEPLNCTVKIQEDQCEIWTGTQSPLLHQMEVANFLGLSPDKVIFNTPFLGGSFGRRGSFGNDWVMEAVHIARISGKPIKLIWSREDDIRGGYYRPFYVHRAQIAVDKEGLPTAWLHRIVGQSLFVNTPLEKDIAPNGIDYSSIGGVHGSPYLETVPDHAVELHTTVENVPVLAWRSVGHTHTAFVMETLIDELAVRAGTDPVEYRRNLLKNHPRHLNALNLAVEKSEWNKPLPAGRFRGIAIHEAMNSFISQVVEISVENKKIKVHRVVCAIDCGLAVNPDGVKAQMESAIIFGLTATLYGEITIEQGKVRQSNFNDYKMLRINETPSIETYIVQSTGAMGGAGEPGVPPVAPALVNAIFAATGKRIRTLPVRQNELFQ